MISAEFINRFPINLKKTSNCLKITLVLCVFLYFLVSRIHNIDSRFGFDHDQEIAAESAWNLVKNHRISLIGIETSKGGIFAGPILNWTHTIFLMIWNFDPIALAYQAIFTNLLLLIILFYFVRKISNTSQATIAIFLYALSPRILSYDISGSPISYMNLQTMITIYLYHKIVYERKKNHLITLGLIIGLGYHIHVLLLFSIVPVILLLWKRNAIRARRDLINLLIFFILPLLSALAFDLKHDFLMFKNAILLIHDGSQYNLFKIIEIPRTLLSLLSDTIAQTAWTGPLLILPLIIVAKGISSKNTDKIYKDLLIFIIAPCVLLFFYKGPISEYYLIASVVPFVIYASFPFYILLKFNKYLFLLIMTLVLIFNTNTIITKSINPHSLKAKKQMFEYIIRASNSDQVSIMYNLPAEYNFGFTYLAKWYKIIENNDARYKYMIEHETKLDSINKSQSSDSTIMFGYFKLSSIK